MDSSSSSASRISRIRTCFLDRDGVLNRKMPEGKYVTRWGEFEVHPGVVEAIRRLNEADIGIIVVSNQRGIARGLYTAQDVEEIHSRFHDLLMAHGAHVDRFYFCPHDKIGCDCRKPRPGMFHQAQRDFANINADTSVMVGDSLCDIEFARSSGMLSIFIDGEKRHQKPGAEQAASLADLHFHSLPDAVEALLRSRQ
jgi:D-glycero-D-manno-heptose 1,7-bisphosphate phosphatase